MTGKLYGGGGPVTTPPSAFVAGATGYTGRALVMELVRTGVRTVAHVRPDSAAAPTWRQRFEAAGATVDVSPWTDEAMCDALGTHRPDVVFALLGTTRARGRAARDAGREETYETVDYGLTVMLLRATARCAAHARFVYLSSIGAGRWGRGAYLEVRKRVEAELRASGLDWTIVRPAIIGGADRDEVRTGERMTGRLMDAALRIPHILGARRLADRYRSITSAELARGLARAAFTDGASRSIVRGDELRD
ncbi:MAG TPA: NAD(P)H-binding protein [Longimicrobiales bacterium]|nr:NAD(P)H-binding protein [Longimicrobiales bacterium]